MKKYRAKAKDSDRLVIGYPGFDMNDPDKCLIKTIDDEFIEIDSSTLAMDTGYKDKNGDMIFIGDEIKYYYIDTICVNPDCDIFLHMYQPICRKYTGIVEYGDGAIKVNDIPLAWIGLNAEEIEENKDYIDFDYTVEELIGIEILKES